MSFKTITYQTIGLAGIAQASHLVDQLATTGRADKDAIFACLNSVLAIDSENPIEIYGGLAGIKIGLQQLANQLGTQTISNPTQARYAASLVFLQSKFAEDPAMQSTVQNKILLAHRQSEHFGVSHENVIANLADIYHTTISTLTPRIMVNGEQNYLSSPETINKIRALLLAGIRSATLWKQCGGSRWRFLFFRRKIQQEAEFLLSEIENAK